LVHFFELHRKFESIDGNEDADNNAYYCPKDHGSLVEFYGLGKFRKYVDLELRISLNRLRDANIDNPDHQISACLLCPTGRGVKKIPHDNSDKEDNSAKGK
jgi:hypothetical protein